MTLTFICIDLDLLYRYSGILSHWCSMHYRHLYLHPLMHTVTYKNGIRKNLKSKTATRLKHFVYGRTHICLLAIVNVTYITQCYDIKSSTVVKSLKNMWHTDKMVLYIFWYWLFVFPEKINFWSIQLFGIHDAVWSFNMVFTYWFMFLCYNSLVCFQVK